MILRTLSILLLIVLHSSVSAAEQHTGRKVMLLNSYHDGYLWTHDITQAVRDKFIGTGVELEVFNMDTKRRRTEQEKQGSAQKAKAAIDAFAPDVLIASDDDASKYVIAPFYKNTDLPVVFCGINWDASSYGFTKKDTEIALIPNITGMVERHLITPVINHLSRHAKGERIGFLSFDGISERKSLHYFQKILQRSFNKVYFHTDYESWKQSFLALQDEVDMMILYNPHGLIGWNQQQAIQFVEQNIKIPIGTTLTSRMPFSVFGIVQLGSEQGAWSAETALRILAGEHPSNIPITHNKQGKLMINMRLVNKLQLKVDLKLLKTAEIIQ